MQLRMHNVFNNFYYWTLILNKCLIILFKYWEYSCHFKFIWKYTRREALMLSVIHGQHTDCHHNFYKHHTDGRQAQYTKGQDAQQLQARIRPHTVCKITQRNNTRRTNTCDPALKLLNEEVTSDILKHKQNKWKEHTGITGTTRKFCGRPYTVYPTEHLHPH